MMSGIRCKDTKPEMVVRRALFAAGFRFRLHRHDLPGTPDVVLTRRKLAIFVHGCFWHQHQGCRYAKMPASNEQFWIDKLRVNRERDQKNIAILLKGGWRVLIVWECFIRSKDNASKISGELASKVRGNEAFMELSSVLPTNSSDDGNQDQN